jgi:hypothetical protein
MNETHHGLVPPVCKAPVVPRGLIAQSGRSIPIFVIFFQVGFITLDAPEEVRPESHVEFAFWRIRWDEDAFDWYHFGTLLRRNNRLHIYIYIYTGTRARDTPSRNQKSILSAAEKQRNLPSK